MGVLGGINPMEGCHVHSIAFTTGKLGSIFATILAYPGAPDSQFRVVVLGMSKGCVMASGKHHIAICRSGTSPGTQMYLEGMLTNPALLVFWMDIPRDICVY